MGKVVALPVVLLLGMMFCGCCMRYTRVFVTEGTPEGSVYSQGKIDTLGCWTFGLGCVSVWRQSKRDLVSKGTTYGFKLHACCVVPSDSLLLSYAELYVDSLLVFISPEVPPHVLHLADEYKIVDNLGCSGLSKYLGYDSLSITPQVDTIQVQFTARCILASTEEEVMETFTTRMYRVNEDIRYLQCWIPLD